jgi:hypothetical protein
MIRCIQIGTITVQGVPTEIYPDPDGEYGLIESNGSRYFGKLLPSYRHEPKKQEALCLT